MSNKKISVFLILILFLISILLIIFLSLISAQNEVPSDLEKIQKAGEKIENVTGGVISEEGIKTEEIKEKLPGWKSKAEERIDKINNYVGPISRILFNTEIKLSWIFIYALLLWIILFMVILDPVKEALNLSIILSIIVGVAVASLAMHSFGDNLVLWISTITKSWYATVITILFSIVIIIFLKIFGTKIRESKEKQAKEQETQHRKILKTSADIEKKRLESYKE